LRTTRLACDVTGVIVGARFVCGGCRLRGYTLPCPRCGGDRLDLAQPTTASELEARWPAARLWRGGHALASLRSFLAARTAWTLAAAQLAVLMLVGVSMQVLAEGAPSLSLLGAWLLGALVAVPLYAALLYLVAVLLVHRGVVSLGRLSAVLPRVRLDVLVVPRETRGTATIVTPLVVRRVRDEATWMPLDDAWLEPAELELDGETLRLDLVAGAIDLAGSVPAETEAERDAGYREATPAPPPAWARGPGRDARIERLVLAAGTRLLVRGGEIASGALRGDREHPLHLERFTR
jgi:hypothetical protein